MAVHDRALFWRNLGDSLDMRSPGPQRAVIGSAGGNRKDRAVTSRSFRHRHSLTRLKTARRHAVTLVSATACCSNYGFVCCSLLRTKGLCRPMFRDVMTVNTLL